jgi:tetratricopeptide (TPR) repeat protein
MRIMWTGALMLAMAVPALLAQPKPKSRGEAEALQAMQNAKTPDERIAAAENVLTKYADTEFKSIALLYEAFSYQQKGDWENAIIFGDRAVEADPKNYQALLLVAQQVVQHTKEFDLDREEKLNKVEKYANNAITAVKAAPKPRPELSDEQWAAAQKDAISQAHEMMGLAAMIRKKYDTAEAEFKAAVEGTPKPDPTTVVRLGMAYSDDGKYDQAIAEFDKAMAMPDALPQVRQFAQAQRVRAIQKKGAKAPPATPPASPAAPANPAPPPAAPPVKP